MDYSPQGWEKEKPARGKRKELDLWITARRAGRKKSPRQMGEKRTGSMDYSPQGWEKDPIARRSDTI